MTYQEFKNKYNGKYVDVDNFPKEWKYQCFDLAQLYITEVLGLPYSILAGCGNVKNMLVKPKIDVLLKYFDEIPTDKMRTGDLCIWSANHIAIFDHYDGQCWYFSQNPNKCQVMTINMSGLHAFRKKEKHKIAYTSHVQKLGWLDYSYDGEISGTTGEKRRLEAIKIDYDKEVYAKAHIQKDGWVDYGKITKDTIIGTTGQQKRLEALCLKGDFEYSVHISGFGWSNWTKADGIITLGSVGLGKSIEAIKIKVD